MDGSQHSRYTVKSSLLELLVAKFPTSRNRLVNILDTDRQEEWCVRYVLNRILSTNFQYIHQQLTLTHHTLNTVDTPSGALPLNRSKACVCNCDITKRLFKKVCTSAASTRTQLLPCWFYSFYASVRNALSLIELRNGIQEAKL